MAMKKLLFAVAALLLVGAAADATTFPVLNTDPFLYTVATASWSSGATTISIPAGLSGIAAGNAVLDNNKSANGTAAVVGIVSSYNSGTGALTISAAKTASAGSSDSLGVGIPQGAGCSTTFYRNPFCKSVNVAGTYRPVGAGARTDGNYYISDGGFSIGGPPTATASWSVGATTISTQTGLSITNGSILQAGSKLIGYIASYSGSTITLQAGAYNSGTSGVGLGITNLYMYQYQQIPAGNSPDPDLLDATIATKAQFEAKWCAGASPCSNANMMSFLEAEKGLTSAQVSRIFYVQQGGTAATGAACENNPATPCGTMAPVMTALDNNLGGVVIVRGGIWTGAPADSGFIYNTSLIVTSSPNTDQYTEAGQIVTGTGVTGGTTLSAYSSGFPGSPRTGLTYSGSLYTINNSQNVGSAINTAGTASWTTASASITVATGLTIPAGAVIYDPVSLRSNGLYGQVIGAASSYNSGTGVITLTANALGASAGASDPLFIGTPETLTFSSPTGVTGGVGLDFNPCSFNNGNPCWSLSGKAGSPLLVMAYPGETVYTNISAGPISSAPYPFQCCVTLDGLTFKLWEAIGPASTLDTLEFAEMTNITLNNIEIMGGDKISFGNNSGSTIVKNSVLHETGAHAIYFLNSTSDGEGIGGPNFTFASNQQTCRRGSAKSAIAIFPAQECASGYGYVLNNSIYSTGGDGFDAMHVSTTMNNLVIEGNTFSYIGGSPSGLQTGPINITVKGNTFFDNADSVLTPHLGHTDCSLPANVKNIDIENNVSWSGKTSDIIRFSEPADFLSSDNASGTGYVTPCPNTFVGNYKVMNNVAIVDNNYPTTSISHFQWGFGSNPSTAQIFDNFFWSNNGSPNVSTDIIAVIMAGADSMPVTACTTTFTINFPPVLGAHGCTLSQFESLNSGKFASGNHYVDPLFQSVSTTFTTTPNAFNFLLKPSSPACNLAGPAWLSEGC